MRPPDDTDGSGFDDPTAVVGHAGVVYRIPPIPLDPDATTFVDAGVVTFGVEPRVVTDELIDHAYVDDPLAAAEIEAHRPATIEDHGISIHVLDAAGVERVRFDCFADDPHYHYIVAEAGVQRYVHHDPVAGGDVLDWALDAIEQRLAPMLAAAGATGLAEQVASTDLSVAHRRLRDAAYRLAGRP